MAVAEDFARGWNAPLTVILSSALLMLPISALLVVALAISGMNVAILSALITPVQLFGNFWIAGRRSRKH